MPVVEDSDQVLPLLRIGDVIETDEGPGVLTSVQFNTAQYNGRWELEPPQLVVQLDSGQTIHTCLCSIELPKTVKGTRLLHQEFNRLWPPHDDVPENSEMLIPEGDEEPTEEPIREGERTAKMNKVAISQEQFDQRLEEIVDEDRHTLLSVPGVYEVAYEAFNGELDENELEAELASMSGGSILQLPGMYEVLSEAFNNDVLREASVASAKRTTKMRHAANLRYDDLELSGWLDSETDEFVTFVFRLLASLPGGDRAEDAGYAPLAQLGWQEVKMITEMLDKIESTSDVDQVISDIFGDDDADEY